MAKLRSQLRLFFQPNYDWERRQEIVATHVGLSNTRVAHVSQITAARGYSEQYSLFQFVWKIQLGNGSVYYDQGGTSTWGFYEGSIWESTVPSCVGPNQNLPDFKSLHIYPVNRE